MTDPAEARPQDTRPGETPHFETDDVQASRGREQGLGVGARELDAQRDPGGVRMAEAREDEADPDALNQSLAVQGEDEEGLPPAQGAPTA